MQRITLTAVAAAALSAVLLTGCADKPCPDGQATYYNTEDGRYHYENVGGPLVPEGERNDGCASGQQEEAIDVDVKVKKPSTRARK